MFDVLIFLHDCEVIRATRVSDVSTALVEVILSSTTCAEVILRVKSSSTSSEELLVN